MSHVQSSFRAVSQTNLEKDPKELVRHIQELARAINLLGEGKSGNIIEVTLTENSDTTVVVSQVGVRIGPGSAFFFDPMTANARAELAGGPPYALDTDRLIGQVTLRHTNSAQTDRTFRMIVVG